MLQHQKLYIATSKNMYCNISNSSTATSQKINRETWKWKHSKNHLLQQPKNPIATFKNHRLQHPKKPYCNTE
jgi:hypothetical protein